MENNPNNLRMGFTWKRLNSLSEEIEGEKSYLLTTEGINVQGNT